MVPRKTTKQKKPSKKPSKTLQNKVAAYNRLNESTQKKLNKMKSDIFALAKKEGIAVH